MIQEFLFLIQSLGLKKNFKNVAAMMKARSAIRGYLLTTCLWSLNDIGLTDELLKKDIVNRDEFSNTRKIDPVILGYLIQYLVRLGFIAEDGRNIKFSRKGKEYWEETNGVFNIFSAYQPFFKNLTGLLKKETSLGMLKRDDLSVALGFRETGARFTFAILEKLIQELHPRGIVELGCGNLDLSLFIAKEHPEINFLGIDYDDRFLNQASETLKTHHFNGHMKLLKRDIFDLSPKDFDFSAFDLVTAIDLFHGYYFNGSEKLKNLFSALRKTFPGKQFLISEVCLPDENRMKALSYPHVEHELFHNLTGQKTFKQGELESLLEECGFKIKKSWSARNLAARTFLLFE